MESRVELFARIRRDARVEGISIRELARRHGVGRPTVRQALAQAEPPARKPRVRTAPRLDVFKPAIDEMLRQDLDGPRKQRHTARRVFARLAEEHDAIDLSYSTVRDYVRRRRPEIDIEAGRLPEVFVPQEHAPGAEAEVDFGEVWVMLAGVKTKCHMFAFRLSHSGKAIHRIYPTQAQEAFLEGHIDAFEDIGGIPTRHIRYDNLTDAVVKVIYGSNLTSSGTVKGLPFGTNPITCAPCAFVRWVRVLAAHEQGRVPLMRLLQTITGDIHICQEPLAELAELNPDDALFQPEYKNGAIKNRSFTGNVVNDVVQRRLLEAGYPASKYGAHSLRAGFVTQSFRAGSTHHEIMRQTGHKSVATVEIYSRENDPLRHNSVTSLGL